MVIEMPVLDQALIACLVAFGPLMIAPRGRAADGRLMALAARAIPSRGLPFYADVALDTVRQDPEPSGAVLQGLFFGRAAPPPDERRAMLAPTLVIGHRRDPIHPLTDAGMLADELPNGRLLEANSFVELRLTPDRLTGGDRELPRRVLEAGARAAGAARARRGFVRRVRREWLGPARDVEPPGREGAAQARAPRA